MKIAIVGAGNAGCITALHYHKYLDIDNEIVIYHSPEQHPIERVGQGTFPTFVDLIANTLDINWYDNPIDATFKSGILYEGWGKPGNKFFHPFHMEQMSMHFVPQKLSKVVLESGYFNVIEKTVTDPEKEIDANVIFDCRGRHNRDDSNYEALVNPLNSVLLYKKQGRDPNLIYTRSIATPNGWTFVIPNVDSVSYGYLYNDEITTKEDAESDFINLFDVEPNNSIPFKNYVAKSIWKGERTVLNGNMFSFIEPLEATSALMYARIAEIVWFDGLLKENTMENRNNVDNQIRDEIMKTQTFLLWHYQNGSKYDTPFWHYAKSLPFERYGNFDEFIEKARDWNCISDIKRGKSPFYSQWPISSFYNWLQTI